MKIYIAGKITGNPDYKEHFDIAQKVLESDGHTVMNPAVLPEGMTKADYMRICLAMIDSCDKVALLENAGYSAGAKIEKDYAEYIGKPITFVFNPTSDQAPVETCYERVKREHPDDVDNKWNGGVYGCPYQYGYVSEIECQGAYCLSNSKSCNDCWNQPVKEKKQ